MVGGGMTGLLIRLGSVRRFFVIRFEELSVWCFFVGRFEELSVRRFLVRR